MAKVESPWDGIDTWAVWLILLVIATLFIHNGMQTYRKAKR